MDLHKEEAKKASQDIANHPESCDCDACHIKNPQAGCECHDCITYFYDKAESDATDRAIEEDQNRRAEEEGRP